MNLLGLSFGIMQSFALYIYVSRAIIIWKKALNRLNLHYITKKITEYLKKLEYEKNTVNHRCACNNRFIVCSGLAFTI